MKEQLIQAFLESRNLDSDEEVNLFYSTLEKTLADFEYKDLEILLNGFNDNASFDQPMYELFLTVRDQLAPANYQEYVEAFLKYYTSLVPQAEEWLDNLLSALVIKEDDNGWHELKKAIEKGLVKKGDILEERIAFRIQRIENKSILCSELSLEDTQKIVLKRLKYLITVIR